MPLPKLNQPTFTTSIPSSKKTVRFRPMLWKEEKILLLAKESGEDKDILDAVKQVVNNCVVDQDFDVEKIKVFDLEWLFIQIRKNSVSNITPIQPRDGKEIDVDLNLTEVWFPPEAEDSFPVGDDVSIKLKWPEAGVYSDPRLFSDDDAFELLVIKSIEAIYQGEERFDPTSYPEDELKEFLLSLDIPAWNKIRTFFNSTPRIRQVVEYVNNAGEKATITLSGLQDFFTFR